MKQAIQANMQKIQPEQVENIGNEASNIDKYVENIAKIGRKIQPMKQRI